MAVTGKSMSIESSLQALRRKLSSDPSLAGLVPDSKVWVKEAPVIMDGQPVRPPYAVIDFALGQPDGAALTLTAFFATDSEAYAALRRMFDGLHDQVLQDAAFSKLVMVGQDVGMDGPQVWYASMDFELTTTESK